MGLIGQVHIMAWEEGNAAALARRRVWRRRCLAGAGEGGSGRPADPGGRKRPNGLAGYWAGWAGS
jgi:hypothetical protein